MNILNSNEITFDSDIKICDNCIYFYYNNIPHTISLPEHNVRILYYNDIYYIINYNKLYYDNFINCSRDKDTLITVINNINNYKEKTVFIENAFIIDCSTNNGGHTFSLISNALYLFFKNNLNTINNIKVCILESLLEQKKFNYSVILSFISEDNIIIMKDNIHYNINKLYYHHNIEEKRNYSTSFILNKIYSDILTKNIYNTHYENISIIKTSDTFNNTPNRAFSIEYNYIFKKYNFITIHPENYKIDELYYILYNCKNIIMSWGCCSYLNSIFLNKNVNILLLCNINYKHEYENRLNDNIEDTRKYEWYPKEYNKCIIMKDLTSNLTSNIEYDLENNIKSLINI